jgi:hypothetical protein
VVWQMSGEARGGLTKRDDCGEMYHRAPLHVKVYIFFQLVVGACNGDDDRSARSADFPNLGRRVSISHTYRPQARTAAAQ